MDIDTTKLRYKGLQDILRDLDFYGCCMYLSLASIIEESTGRPFDFVLVTSTALSTGWLQKDGTVRDALSILSFATDKKWSRTTVKELGTIGQNEYTVEQWSNPTTGMTHYRRRCVDTLFDSRTVANGKLVCYHVFTEQRG